jgi:ABC-type branched-subunit amino acid transport system substrate-binding protein
VDNIDAIFVPIASSDEIAVVSSQLRFFNFTGTLLGTGDWHELTELDRNRSYTNGVLFSVDAYINEKDSATAAFIREYRQRVGRAPTANAFMGHDVAHLVLSVIAKGATIREEVAEGLSQVRDFNGLRSKVSFTPQRVNGFLWVMQYRNGKVVNIGSVDLTQEPVEEEDGSVPVQE